MEIKDDQVYILTVLKRIKHKKKLFLSVSAITFITACLLILPVPRYYSCEVILAPEINIFWLQSWKRSNRRCHLARHLSATAKVERLYPELSELPDKDHRQHG